MTIRMIWAGGRRHVSAGHPADLIAELIPGYAILPPQRRRAARVTHAESTLARIRQRLAAAFGPDGAAPTVLVDVHHPDESRGAVESVMWLSTEDDERYLRSLATVGEIFLTLGERHPRGMPPEFAEASGEGGSVAPAR
ncbi:hypothetical protein AB0J90_25040 [Micromonospora sp. NPDC049523]|uniref:hypothetical protein n=1 Tax=Micromonospora sp. NPDC049523 TaxID=3155921 RepID=UPI003424BD20